MIKYYNSMAQMVIWAIVAIAIVAIIVFVSMIAFKPRSVKPGENNPQAFIQKCVRDATFEVVEKIMPQGGFVDPINYKVWNGIKVPYLCENTGYYERCINQHPALINEIRKEIYNYIYPRVENCFSQLKTEWAKRKENVALGEMNLSVELAPGKVFVDIERKTDIEKNGEKATYNNYKTEMVSPLYDLASVANVIAEQQAKYCYFEYVGYMTLYPRWEIEVDTLDDSTRIYNLKDVESGKEMNIAIRGCAIPAGI